MPHEHPPARGVGTVAQLGEQPGLADARVPGEQDRRAHVGGLVGGTDADEAHQPVELIGSADQWASDISDGGHVPHHRGNQGQCVRRTR